ncbi:MAG: transposase, partial [Chloroflexales bacterium]|nr:transposase [Chloroflexales bacterium]
RRRAFERLELYAGKLARTVLRGRGGGNAALLPDTSQACSCCGHIARNNRRSRGRFVCRKCGYELHADLNAARNIAAKYHASVARRDAGGLPVNQPIVPTSMPLALE